MPKVMDDLMRTGEPAGSKRLIDAMLKMVKLDIAALRAVRQAAR